jgi:hypothetical protein
LYETSKDIRDWPTRQFKEPELIATVSVGKMARTRAQDKAATPTDSKPAKRRPDTASSAEAEPVAKKAKAVPASEAKSEAKKVATKPKAADSTESANVARLLKDYGAIPLSTTSLADPSKPTAETLLALLLNALLSSARISHQLAARATAGVIDAGYHKLETLKKSTFEERCKVLTDGGYARYREKTAEELRLLGEWLESEYGECLPIHDAF